ncbi:Uncharacterised protein [Legionella gratiana]|uniref:Uncharacterized protein n=1 Tax=Legionella gratiana TaxID=45066 RepID=A0A378JBN2_9GAMM|nr:Uncharacterised protein [Legionella gratiana]
MKEEIIKKIVQQKKLKKSKGWCRPCTSIS